MTVDNFRKENSVENTLLSKLIHQEFATKHLVFYEYIGFYSQFSTNFIHAIGGKLLKRDLSTVILLITFGLVLLVRIRARFNCCPTVVESV